jgi:hypothetical protein
VSFAFVPAPAPAALAVTTTVDDWTISASGEGFVNVDVSAEARLLIAGSQSPLTDARVLVFDGQAPFVDVPPAVQATVGAPLVVPIQASDDSSDGYLIPPDRRRPGVSGLKSVEWALDPEGKGTPKEWQPAVWLGGVNYEARLDSAKLPFGVRMPMLVRATDAVGLSDPPARVWDHWKYLVESGLPVHQPPDYFVINEYFERRKPWLIGSSILGALSLGTFLVLTFGQSKGRTGSNGRTGPSA